MATENSQTKKSSMRGFISVLTALFFLAMVVTGAAIFVTPPGRVAYSTNWQLWGFTKDQWRTMHLWFCLLFVLTSLYHLFFNLRVFLSYFKSKSHRKFGLRLDWCAAILVTGVLFFGMVKNVPPFPSLLVIRDRIKYDWRNGNEQESGIVQTKESMPGSGIGRMTLRQYCESADLELSAALANLRHVGIEAHADQTIRDLAGENGIHPRDIRRIVARSPESQGRN
jgi:hypothetical protein